MTLKLGRTNPNNSTDVLQDGSLYGEYEFDLAKNQCRVRRAIEQTDGTRKRFLPTTWQRLEMLSEAGQDKQLATLFSALPINSDYWPEESGK